MDAKSGADKILNISNIVSSPSQCPYCKMVMKGPFTQYEKREKELYFDLVRKYEFCEFCRVEVEIVDFQVFVERIARMLPPSLARSFSMKNFRLYKIMPEETTSLLLTIYDDAEGKLVLPMDNLTFTPEPIINT